MCIRDSDYSIKKFSKSLWSLCHLKRARMSEHVLLDVYKIMLRPILEFCSPIYHSLITKEQSCKLERLQKTALYVIYGFDKKYESILHISGLQTLEERRKNAFKNFALSVVKNERYASWFPRQEGHQINLREKRTFTEHYARTDRLYNSPLYSMRRLLNEEYRETRNLSDT